MEKSKKINKKVYCWNIYCSYFNDCLCTNRAVQEGKIDNYGTSSCMGYKSKESNEVKSITFLGCDNTECECNFELNGMNFCATPAAMEELKPCVNGNGSNKLETLHIVCTNDKCMYNEAIEGKCSMSFVELKNNNATNAGGDHCSMYLPKTYETYSDLYRNIHQEGDTIRVELKGDGTYGEIVSMDSDHFILYLDKRINQKRTTSYIEQLQKEIGVSHKRQSRKYNENWTNELMRRFDHLMEMFKEEKE